MFSFYKHEFVGTLERRSMGFNKRGELFYNVIYVPSEVCAELPMKKYPRLRIEGEMHDMPFEGAMQPDKGRWYLLVSAAFMKENGLSLGDDVEIRFNEGDQDYVDVPDELTAALRGNEAANAIWQTLTPGKKRSFATPIANAKTAPTRQKRALKAIAQILEIKPK